MTKKPFCRNGDGNGAVTAPADEATGPAHALRPRWLCCCCGEPVADSAVIDVIQDGSRLTGLTARGRAMMTLTIDGAVETTVAILDYADAVKLVEEFTKRQLVVARHVEDDL